MKKRLLKPGLFAHLAGVSLLLAIPAARAGLTFELQIYNSGSQSNYTYNFNPLLATNSTGANVSFGTYAVTSFGIPTNGSSSLWQFDANGFNQIGGVRNSYSDFNSLAHEITNGVWSLFVTNATITNVYYFRVALNVSSNDLPKVLVTFPLDGAVDVTNQPTFAWQGPANYGSLVVSEFNVSQSLPVSQTNWLSARQLYQGRNNFNVEYVSNSIPAAMASIPTNSLAQPFFGWVSTNVLDVSYGCQFSVGLPDTSGTSNSLVAHYPFEATNGAVLSAALDTSGNSYNMSFAATFGSLGGENITSISAAGIGAVRFQDGDNSSGGSLGWTNPTPPALLATLAGSFSVSCWIKTTQNIAWNTAPAFFGAGIVSADNLGLANDVIPIALTGGSIGFNTGGSTEDVTLNSKAGINDGNYHHVVVTRNRQTGQKIIYIDGQFDSFASGTTNLLSDPQKLTIGALANAGNPDPNDNSYSQGFDGELDDLQIYSGVLSAADVSYLHSHPGLGLTTGGSDFNAALGTAGLTWTNSGDASWFTETNNTDTFAPAAAQSGSLTNTQSSTLSTTVTGPGTLTFYWSSVANDTNGGFVCEFDLDGNFADRISGDAAWSQDGPFPLGPGQHTLTWTASANGDTDFTEAAFLDQVSDVGFLTATASPLSGADPLTVKFSSPDADTAGNIVTNRHWDFGDGGTSTAQNPLHTFHYNASTYSPSLVAQSVGVGLPVVTGPGAITVTKPRIIVQASPRSGKEPLMVQFSSPAVDSVSNAIASWNWDFGDGATSTAQNPVHTYANLGSFSPSLAVTNTAGVSPVVTGPGAINVTLSQSAFQTNLPGSPAGFTYHDFSNPSSLRFNGSAAMVNNSNGAVLELTKSGSPQSGSAFSSIPLSFTHHAGFGTFFVFRLGDPGVGTPGDGIAFTIQGVSPLALGNGGTGNSGLKNSLSVEFDAFKSGTQTSVPGGLDTNQIAINTNGAASYLVSVPVTPSLDNGGLWYAWIDYEGVSQDLQVRLSQVPVRPHAPTLDTTVNLPGIFGLTNTATAGGNLLVNGDFENEPNWGGGIYYAPGSVTAFVSNQIPGWTIEPNHALTIHLATGIDPTISGNYSANPDGEGYQGNNANFYQDFNNNANATYTLSFNWQSWGQSLAIPTTSQQQVSVEDTVTGSVLFNGLYAYDGNNPHPVHSVTASFQGTGNPLRLRIQESPQSGYNDNTFIMDNFSVTGPPKYINAYVGFTGAGQNQQDILAWQFRALQATRITGIFNTTNLAAGLHINKGIVLARHIYVVAGVPYTNYTYAPIATVSNSNAQIAFTSGIAELNTEDALPASNNVSIAVSNNAAAIDNDVAGINQFAMLAAYTNSGSGGEGAVLNYDNPDYIQFAPYYANNGFPPFNMNEQMYNTLQDQIDGNPPPGLVPPVDLAQLQIDSPTFPGPNDPQWVFPGPDGDIEGDTVLYSLGTPVGTLTARQQVIESPPEPLIVASPRSDGSNFLFSFSTVLNQSYTVWANANLGTTNWLSYTNLNGDGYFQKITIPLTNSPQNFYQLTSP